MPTNGLPAQMHHEIALDLPLWILQHSTSMPSSPFVYFLSHYTNYFMRIWNMKAVVHEAELSSISKFPLHLLGLVSTIVSKIYAWLSTLPCKVWALYYCKSSIISFLILNYVLLMIIHCPHSNAKWKLSFLLVENIDFFFKLLSYCVSQSYFLFVYH